VRWLSGRANGVQVGPPSNYQDAETNTARVLNQREPPVSAHWQFLLEPLEPWYESRSKEKPAWRHLADERLPAMTLLASRDPEALELGDWVRLTFMDEGSDRHDTLPYAQSFLEDFRRRYCYDRFWDPETPEHAWMRTRFVCCGYHMLVVGRYDLDAADPFVMNAKTGLLFHFREQYFQLGLFVHMQYGSLVVFLDRLYRAEREGRKTAATKLHRLVQAVQRDFVSFTAGLWFTEVTSHMQGKELYERWMREMGVQKLSEEVRSELQIAHESLAGMESLKLTQAATELAPAAIAVAFWGMNITIPPPSLWSAIEKSCGAAVSYGAQFGALVITWAVLRYLLRLLMKTGTQR
jgi:hypothetical protein